VHAFVGGCGTDCGDLQLLHGPPGTGKTKTLTAVLQTLYAPGEGSGSLPRKKRTLVCAPSNKAVLELLGRLLVTPPRTSSLSVVLIGDADKLCPPSKGLPSSDEELLPVVPGPAEHRSIRADCFVHTFVDGICARLGRLTCHARQGGRGVVLAERSPSSSSSSASSSSASTTSYTTAGDNSRGGGGSAGGAHSGPRELGRPARWGGLSAALGVERRRLKRSLPGTYRSTLRPLFRAASAAATVCEHAESAREGVGHGWMDDDDDLGDEAVLSADPSSSAESRAAASMDARDMRWDEALQDLLRALAALSPPPRGTADQHLAVVQELLASADVVFCTLTVAGSHVVLNMPAVDTLIIDEAAQAIEPELLIPLGVGARHGAGKPPRRLLLAGDPRQLGATLTSQRAQQAGLGRSLLGRLMEDCGRPASLLTLQYR
jgi:hypothetical protein